MTRRTALPSAEDVRTAIQELNDTTGRPPTVLALARHLGLANTTFRRNFPDTTVELNHVRSRSPSPQDPAGISTFEQLKRDNAKLRRDNHDLTEHLELAVANIQRLTLDNHHLRQQLDTTANITRIDMRGQPGTPRKRPR